MGRRAPAPPARGGRQPRASPLSGAATAAARAETPPSPSGHLGDSLLASDSRRGGLGMVGERKGNVVRAAARDRA